MNSLIRAGGLQGYASLMRTLGQDPLPLLKKYNLSETILSDVDSLISLSGANSLLEESSKVCQCPTFGLQLASQQNFDLLGIVSLIIQIASTTEEAINNTIRYLFLHSPAMEFSVKPESDLYSNCVVFSLAIHQNQYATQKQAIDSALGYMWKFVQSLIQTPSRLKGVSLPHATEQDCNTYRRFFGAPVHFEQPYAGLHVPKEALSHSLKSIDPHLQQYAMNYISSNKEENELLISEQVRRAITRTLGESRATKQIISDMLAIHPRTLQRRLSNEGKTFEEIQDEVYSKTAFRFLTETEISLTQLTDILGFKNQSAFTRSVRRWFGKSPSEIRKALSI